MTNMFRTSIAWAPRISECNATRFRCRVARCKIGSTDSVDRTIDDNMSALSRPVALGLSGIFTASSIPVALRLLMLSIVAAVLNPFGGRTSTETAKPLLSLF